MEQLQGLLDSLPSVGVDLSEYSSKMKQVHVDHDVAAVSVASCTSISLAVALLSNHVFMLLILVRRCDCTVCVERHGALRWSSARSAAFRYGCVLFALMYPICLHLSQ